MIYTERVISVKGGTASIDAPIVLYRGDRNIEIVFEIINSKFKFSEKGNYILDIGAKYGQLAVDMPDGTDLFTDIAKCMDGKVIFKITGDMINEIAENGFYSFHVRLFNDDKTSRVTIPPIMEGIEIREPIVIEGDAIFPIVDMGGVDIAPIDSDEETFIDENGKLDIRWVTGDIISSTRLNQMVEYINENTYSRDEFDLSSYIDKDYLDNEIQQIDMELNMFDAELTNTKYLFETINGDIIGIKSSYVTAEYVDEKNNEVTDKLIVVESEIDALQEGLDYTTSRLNEYATEEYVDAKESSLNLRIDGIVQDIELVRQIAESNDFTDEVNTIDGRVDGLENKITNVESNVGVINETVTNQNTNITNIQNAISGVDGIDAKLATHRVEIETIKENLNDINGRIENGSDLSGHATEVYVDNKVEALEETMNGLIDDQNETIKDHVTRIESLEDAVANIPESPDLSGYATTEYVDGKITDIRGTLSDHITYIGDNQSNIMELDDRITALENLEGGSTIGVGKDYVDQKDNEIRVILGDHYAEIEDNQQDIIKLENQLGDINAILDAINGEVI